MAKQLNWLNRNLEAVIGGFLLAMVVSLITIQVVMRYIFESSLSWSEELTLWSFIWFIWIGISYAFKERKHVKVTFFQGLFPEKVQKVTEVIIDVVIVVFLAMLIYHSLKLINLPYVASQRSVVLGLPIPVLYASAPIGAALSIFRIVQHYSSVLCPKKFVQLEVK